MDALVFSNPEDVKALVTLREGRKWLNRFHAGERRVAAVAQDGKCFGWVELISAEYLMLGTVTEVERFEAAFEAYPNKDADFGHYVTVLSFTEAT